MMKKRKKKKKAIPGSHQSLVAAIQQHGNMFDSLGTVRDYTAEAKKKREELETQRAICEFTKHDWVDMGDGTNMCYNCKGWDNSTDTDFAYMADGRFVPYTKHKSAHTEMRMLLRDVRVRNLQMSYTQENYTDSAHLGDASITLELIAGKIETFG